MVGGALGSRHTKRMPAQSGGDGSGSLTGSLIAIHRHVHARQLRRAAGKALQRVQTAHMDALSLQGSKRFEPHGATAMQENLAH